MNEGGNGGRGYGGSAGRFPTSRRSLPFDNIQEKFAEMSVRDVSTALARGIRM